MARKLVDQDEAARILGVTVEEVNALRDRKELFPYRDGDTWKYKPEDLERLKNERDAGGSGWQPGDIPLEVHEEVDSILLSEKELGESPETTSSTIIGKSGKDRPSADSDIKLGTGASDVNLAAGSSGIGSDVKLVLGGSDAAKKQSASGLSDLELKLEPASDSGKRSSSDSELKLAEPTSGSSTKKGSVKPGSDAKKKDKSSSGDEDVLSSSGSDITRAGDSGIHLVDPKDSGLSLEEPLELGGSSVELLELGEADAHGATQLGTEDEFLLTPVQEPVADQADSGSQLIALDVDEEMSSGAFTPATSGMVAMLEEDTGGEGTSAAGLSPTGALIGGPSLLSASQVPETLFSGWAVAGLACCAILLIMTGMVMTDLYRNLWVMDQPYPVNTAVMDSLAKTVGWMEKNK